MKLNSLKLVAASALVLVAMNASARTGFNDDEALTSFPSLIVGQEYGATFTAAGIPNRAMMSQNDVGASCNMLFKLAQKSDIVVKKTGQHVLVMKDKSGKFDFSPVVRTDKTHSVTIVTYRGQDGIQVIAPIVFKQTGQFTSDFALGACKGSLTLTS